VESLRRSVYQDTHKTPLSSLRLLVQWQWKLCCWVEISSCIHRLLRHVLLNSWI